MRSGTIGSRCGIARPGLLRAQLRVIDGKRNRITTLAALSASPGNLIKLPTIFIYLMVIDTQNRTLLRLRGA
jgi:hypothetical protein